MGREWPRRQGAGPDARGTMLTAESHLRSIYHSLRAHNISRCRAISRSWCCPKQVPRRDSGKSGWRRLLQGIEKAVKKNGIRQMLASINARTTVAASCTTNLARLDRGKTTSTRHDAWAMEGGGAMEPSSRAPGQEPATYWSRPGGWTGLSDAG